MQLGTIDGEHADHANGVFVDLAAMVARYVEPHMKDTDVDDFIPYGAIQASVAGLLSELGIAMEHSPTSCHLQGNDELCVSWSTYLLALHLLNPEISAAVLVQSASYLDVYRMLYVAYTAVPFTFSRGRRARATPVMMHSAMYEGDGEMMALGGDDDEVLPGFEQAYRARAARMREHLFV